MEKRRNYNKFLFLASTAILSLSVPTSVVVQAEEVTEEEVVEEENGNDEVHTELEDNDEENQEEELEVEYSEEEMKEEVHEAALLAVEPSSSSLHFTEEFINSIAPSAQELGVEYGLYPSVMIAQAILESGWGGQSPALPDDYVLSLPPNYNLFGIKGEYNGESVLVTTREYDSDNEEYYEIQEYFRKYPSYEASLVDYAQRLRHNPDTTDPYIYSEAWVENAETYQDATAHLNRYYATDPEYDIKLNNLIENYELYQYDSVLEGQEDSITEEPIETLAEDEVTDVDPANVLDRVRVAYNAQITATDFPIYDEEGSIGSENHVSVSDNYVGSSVVVTEEVTTDNGIYVLIQDSGDEIGWINKDAIQANYHEFLESRTVAYNATISNTNMGIYSTPAWTADNQLVANSADYVGENLVVREEVVTQEATYARVELNGEELGWINTGGIRGQYHPINERRTVAYNATISNANMGIYRTPAWTRGNQLVADSADYVGENLVVREEVVTPEATYARVELNGEELGWINTGGIRGQYHPINERRTVAYNATISNTNMGIYSTPAWTRGNQLVADSADYVGENLVVREEVVTPEATYARIELNGEELGWINAGGIRGQYHPINERRTVAYNASISNTNMGIYSTPAWTRGNQLVANSADYVGENLVVREEVVTPEATYALVEANGEEIGWINIGGIRGNYYSIEERSETSYGARFRNSGSNIYNVPAWTRGNRLVERSANLVGERFIVREEIVTQEARYAKVEIDGQVIGWVNVNALERVPVVYVDPGHGGSEPGAVSGGVQEKDLALSVSLKVEQLLDQKGYIVLMSRDSDETVSLSNRAQEANREEADIFVSIHFNAHNGQAQGIETFYYNGRGNTNNSQANDPTRLSNSRQLAEEIQRELINETGANDRGVKQANFHVLRETEMPAVLVEGGFMDNPTERAKLLLTEYQQRLAEAMSSGINRFLNIFF